MPESMMTAHFWVSVMQIIAIDVLLGGDNAVVIALACRGLPEHQRNRGIFWGVFGAVGLRVVMIFFALRLLALPWLKIVGGLLLLWIGIKLMLPGDDEDPQIHASEHLLGAIRTIVLADAVMSLDNVVAVAGAARGHFPLVIFGIMVSVPIIIWGSKLVLTLMERFPVLITLGGGLLGWIGGGMIATDVAFEQSVVALPQWVHHGASALGAILVVVVGVIWSRRGERSQTLIDEPQDNGSRRGESDHGE